ncbi:hypothetical protein FXO38_12905 [Capsicum annuum]|uniref:Uncharacterized protein n=1 Tax=Capsicum annuum TaxID=4072 RepID=A0A2G3A514_CAPAN|nr:hypothetical protein FXO37_14803 [Capsicum annuum]KAF3658956.1 hypothetical protein FXO38_12905 [Capsicum annuum]PHT89280.1 hypothetical protein T459_04393 [Capsicum annuum]
MTASNTSCFSHKFTSEPKYFSIDLCNRNALQVFGGNNMVMLLVHCTEALLKYLATYTVRSLLSEIGAHFSNPLREANEIDKETFLDLIYINYNLKLARCLVSKPTEEDFLQLDGIDMRSDWVEEAQNPSPTQWLDRFGSGLDGNDLNTP